jgi:plastocyanin
MRLIMAPMLLILAAPAAAAELTVEVRTAAGAPVRNAVVSLYPGGKAVPASAPRAPLRMAQQNTQFSPFVLVVPVGGEVAFPNYDSFRHHVYSFSPAKRFELKLYAKEQSHSVRFDKAGVVPLGCNIHDAMTAFIKVSDTRLAVQTDAAGRATLSDVPAGAAVARIWHPYLRAPGNEIQTRWAISKAGSQHQKVAVLLRPPPRVRTSY